MSTELTDDELRRARATAQLLHRPVRAPAAVVSALLAVQAQDIGAAPLALRARSRGLTASGVAAVRADRSVVRAWGPRGTLHLIAAEDARWLLPLMPPAGSMRRLAQEGTTGDRAELVATVGRVLSDQGPLTKPEFADRLAAVGVVARGQGLVHLLGLAAAEGLVVLGPDRGNKPTYVHAYDWLGTPRARADRDRALAELVRRYLRGHAPAAPADLAAWSGLSTRDIKAGWSAVAGELVEVVHAGRTLWRPRMGVGERALPAVTLLPAFDELLLGWQDRALILDGPHSRRVVPGGGILRPFVLAGGRVAGTWRGSRVELFTEVDPAAVEAELADVARFQQG